MRRPLVMRDRTSKSLSRTRLEPAQLIVPSPPATARRGRPAVEPRALSARAKRSPWQRLDGVSGVLGKAAFGHPPGPYAFRGLLASALRAFP